MTTYPGQIDDDRSIVRIDDNLSELGTDAINQLRSAVFAIEKTLGVNPQGSKSSVNERISVLISADGSINTNVLIDNLSALKIHDNQVAANAGIQESKLDLGIFPLTTSDLKTGIDALDTLVDNNISLTNAVSSNLLAHISGSQYLIDNTTQARHVASQIDINNIPVDSRDVGYNWTGLLDTAGNLRSANNVAEAILQINDELVAHELSFGNAHTAESITLDTSNFTELPITLTNVQEAFDYIDDQETVSTGLDRATLHSNGIIRGVRVEDPRIGIDGYNVNVVPSTKVTAYLAYPGQNEPVDDINNGDDVVKFFPVDNSGFDFDAQFSRVRVGDSLRINYGYGVETVFPIKSIRFVPGVEYAVRINSYNLKNLDGYNGSDGYDGYARIDKALFDRDTWGVMAVAGVVPNTQPIPSVQFTESVIVASPKGGAALGIGFDPAKLDQNHYNLYLRLYPSGDKDVFTDLPAIDVTGNAGSTPGTYSIDYVVETTNEQFRKAGYNYRFIAFKHKGEFGIALSDHYNNVAFSIVSGQVSSTQIIEGPFVKNVIGDATDGYDALGLGALRAAYATPVLGVGDVFADAQTAISYNTLVIPSVKGRNSLVDGVRRDELAKAGMTYPDGYWLATITNVTVNVPNSTKTVEYTVELDLKSQELKPGKTIVVQPIDPSNSNTSNYGRFIIGKVEYSNCGCDSIVQTTITVINAVHGTGNPLGVTLPVNSQVKIFFSEDSVGFNDNHINGNTINGSSVSFHRYNEVFVNNIRETFAVERARMPKQQNLGDLLFTDSDSWRIRRVSPKLKGVRIDNEVRYYKSFVVSSYNTITGEFDGYIGEPDSSGNVINPGPTIRGKKNHPVRFYDHNHVDFIDIEFREFGTNPGTSIITGAPKQVIIEVFDTLREHDQFFALAGVSHNDTQFKSVTDLREFGTLSEENFTDSAIKFIQAGERIIHANGVVRGFKYVGVGSTNSLLQFSGGTALVNGAFVSLDSFDVKLPEVKSSSSDIVDFFICVTQGGQLNAVIKDNGSQFFETDDNYFVETLEFKEIVDKRKDLCVVAKVSARIADQDGGAITYSLESVLDARRFVYNQDVNDWTVALQEDGYFTTLRSAEALKCWAVEYGISEFTFVDKNISSEVDLTGISSDVTIKAKNTITVTSEVGFRAGSNIHFYDVDFIYNAPFAGLPTGFPGVDYNDTANTSLGKACVLFDPKSSNMSNISVKRCSFTRTVAGQRAPFLMATIGNDGYLSDVDFSKNIFVPLDQSSSSNDYANCAIAVLSAATTLAGYAQNVRIEKNRVQGKNCILTTATNPGVGLSARGVYISKNIIPLGMIGYGIIGSNSVSSITTRECLRITDNTTAAITWADGYGRYSPTNDILGCGNITIDKNTAMYLRGVALGNSVHMKSVLKVLNNTLTMFQPYTYMYAWNLESIGNPYPTPEALIVSGPTSTSWKSTYVNVDGNTISSTQSYIYDIGIVINTYGTARGNFIDTFAFRGIDSAGSNTRVIISENTINRNSRSITTSSGGYIACNADTVIDNVFDSTTRDGLNTDTIEAVGTQNIIDRNVNHINTALLSFDNAFKLGTATSFYEQTFDTSGFQIADPDGDRTMEAPNLLQIRAVNGAKDLWLYFRDTGTVTNLTGFFALKKFLPNGAKFVGARVNVNSINTSWDAGNVTLSLRASSAPGTSIYSDSINLTSIVSPATNPLSISSTSKELIDDHSVYVRIDSTDPSVAANILTLENLEIYYTW